MKQTGTKPNHWLLQYRKNYASQRGEDGILEKIFQIIPKQNHWCVEFGAWDGERFSNTWHLLTHKKWSGVLIEANKKRFNELTQRYSGNERVFPINAWITFEGANSLDNLLKATPIPKDFDLLSIDIDGADYHIWNSVKKYQPKVVVIEFNPTIPDDVEWVQEKSMNVRQGHSLRALVNLGKTKGYELICVNDENAIFVRKEYFPLFGIADNSIETLHVDHRYETKMFQGYDGTIMLLGNKRLLWVGINIEKKVQVLPKPLRGVDNFLKYAIIGVLKRIGYYKSEWETRVYDPPQVKYKK